MKKKQIKISSKNQVVIPALVREQMNLKKGSAISIYAIDADHAMITKHPINGSYTESMIGLGKEVWDRLGGVEKYLNGERDSWEKQ